jgi:hypothetical protein
MSKIKIASSPTIEGLQKMINKYFFSENYYIEDMKLKNNNFTFKVPENEIVKEKGKYFIYMITK